MVLSGMGAQCAVTCQVNGVSAVTTVMYCTDIPIDIRILVLDILHFFFTFRTFHKLRTH